jgi:hypothetical protein
MSRRRIERSQGVPTGWDTRYFVMLRKASSTDVNCLPDGTLQAFSKTRWKRATLQRFQASCIIRAMPMATQVLAFVGRGSKVREGSRPADARRYGDGMGAWRSLGGPQRRVMLFLETTPAKARQSPAKPWPVAGPPAC